MRIISFMWKNLSITPVFFLRESIKKGPIFKNQNPDPNLNRNHPIPVENHANLCYTFIIITWVGRSIPFCGFSLPGRKIHGKELTDGDEAAENYLPTYRAERSFALLFCRAFFAKNIPKPSDRHVHGSSPSVNAAVFFSFPAGDYEREICQRQCPPGQNENVNDNLKYIKRGTGI